jgi:hypothetical protein
VMAYGVFDDGAGLGTRIWTFEPVHSAMWFVGEHVAIPAAGDGGRCSVTSRSMFLHGQLLEENDGSALL